MNNKSFQFKTNINCGGCVATVKTHLDKIVGTDQWQVETGNKDKILTVVSATITPDEVVETVLKAGFKIEAI